MSGSTPLVNVITPFHNTAEFLEECVSSVRAQTYPHWHYTLVDNCSTDGGSGIADRLAALDSRIHVVHETELLPQVENYNRALGYVDAGSRWCKIVQADDWLFPTCLEEMVRVGELSPTVGVVGSYSMYGDLIGHTRTLPFSRTPVWPGRIALREFLLQEEGFIGSPTCVLIRSELLSRRRPFFDARFDSYEDVEAVLSLLTESDFAFAFQVLTYNRRDNPGFWKRIENFSPVLLHHYLLLKRFGTQAFPPRELAAQDARVTDAYYTRLAESLVEGESSEFWDFHIERLAAAGLPLEPTRLRRHVRKLLLASPDRPFRNLRALRRMIFDPATRRRITDRATGAGAAA